MSGIVGVLELNGAPVDRSLLLRMTEALAFRGPDAQDVWADGPVGLGHALLRTSKEASTERQPCSLDGRVWITADARIDDRHTLVRKLANHGHLALDGAPDAELILHAYQVWEEVCADHLLGDFAFALWDGERQRLFCARDHMGVKPFYYAHVDGRLIFGNTLESIRLHPSVSDRLNDLAIADFLLFEYNQEDGTTTWFDIQRLPAAHKLNSIEGLVRVAPFWSPPIDEPIRYPREADYVERFREIFDAAVGDRIRTERISLEMSGGIDSTSIAATAVGLPAVAGVDLRCFTMTYERLIPDREGEFARQVAEALGLPWQRLTADDYVPFVGWDRPEGQTPEPHLEPFASMIMEHLSRMNAHARVYLSGYGGDVVLRNPDTYGFRLLTQGRWVRLAGEVLGYMRRHGHLPGLGVRTACRRRLGRTEEQLSYPKWLNAELERRWHLRERHANWIRYRSSPHPVRPEAYENTFHSYWKQLFERCDPGWSGLALEPSFPWFDVRLVKYLLAVPPRMVWFHKGLPRAAMRGRLPEAVRLRRKSPLAGDPLRVLLRAGGVPDPYSRGLSQCLFEYVDPGAVPTALDNSTDTMVLYTDLRVAALNRWLLDVDKSGRREERCDRTTIRVR